MVQIVIYYPYLDGTSTSLIDMYFNLKHYISDVECYVVIDTNDMKRNISYLQQLKNSVPDIFVYKTITMNQLYTKQWDKLIMSFGVFRFIDSLPMNYNNLFILDAGRMIYDYHMNHSKHINYIKGLSNISIYGNKMNQFHCDNFDKYYIWYHKFSKERFDYLKCLESKQKVISMEDRLKTGNIPLEALYCNELSYHRYDKMWGNGIFNCQENIGKLIFEFSAMNKKVVYSPQNKQCDDGLTEYLSLFGINDNEQQEIHITEEQLFDVLGMNLNDVILKHIRNEW